MLEDSFLPEFSLEMDRIPYSTFDFGRSMFDVHSFLVAFYALTLKLFSTYICLYKKMSISAELPRDAKLAEKPIAFNKRMKAEG